jgi:hypothetical protein
MEIGKCSKKDEIFSTKIISLKDKVLFKDKKKLIENHTSEARKHKRFLQKLPLTKEAPL